VTWSSARLERWLPWALVLAVVVVYLPSLPGGFLNYDDPWLIEQNRNFAGADVRALGRIWTDLGRDTRLGLGAEYLPLRDTTHWLEVAVFGSPWAPGMRVVQLGFYLGAVLLMRRALLAVSDPRWPGEVAAWLFALHPVHVESVAWLAGRKDVLALLFVSAALAVHATESRRRIWAVPLLLSGAVLSKSMSVAAICLLPALDLLGRRRPAYAVYAASLAVLVWLAVDIHVGRLVGMTTPPAGGTRWTAAATMGPVWLRYLGLLGWPSGLSVAHDVRVRTGWDAWAVLGWAVLGGWLVAGISELGRKRPVVLASFIFFTVPLAPVSQVLFPLQNLMADRYLYLSVLGPCLAESAALGSFGRTGGALAVALCGLLGFSTIERSALFADSVELFRDATAKTEHSGLAPYQLGQAYEDCGQEGPAIAAYEQVLAREPPPSENARRATNNLAKLWARAGRLVEAERLLRRGVEAWPDDPRVLGNLAEVVAREQRPAEARHLFEALLRRFPDYEWGRAHYRARFGERP
jgi:protein O-mannosyl-transferase